MGAFICHVAEVGPFISLHICLQLLPQRETHLPFREGIQLEAWSNDVLLDGHCFIDDHARNALAIGLLLRCVNTMRLGVNRQAVHFLLNWKILYLAVVDFQVKKKVHSLAVDTETHRVYTPEQEADGKGVARMVVYEAVTSK